MSDAKDIEGSTRLAEGDAGVTPRSSLRTVLDEIGAEEAVARLEEHIESVEGELQRSDRRLQEFERARRGELDVMRARVEDVLGAVDEMIQEHRAGAKDLEARLAAQVAQGANTARQELTELRDTLTPRVQQAVHDAQRDVSALRGELSRFAHGADARIAEVRETVAAVDARFAALAEQTSQGIEQGLAGHAASLEELRIEVMSRLAALDAAGEARQQDGADRLESLRRELDATTGELRASSSMRSSELRAELQAVREELDEAVDAAQARDDSLEERWVGATRDVADRIEQTTGRLEAQVRKEREERQMAADHTEERLNEAMARVDAMGDRIEAIKRPRVDDVRRAITDTESRVDALQGQVAAAVGQIASELNNRVAVVGGDLEAVRATTTAHTEDLARLGGVADAVAEIRTEVAGELQQIRAELTALRQQSQAGAVSGDQTAAAANAVRVAEAANLQARELITTITSMQEELRALAGLRQEVRDQASTLVEAVTRAEAAEQAAIATREALAAAVRRGREARAGAAQPPTDR